ncbi:MAG: Smr/MutS family protein [Acidobacteriota bacterium]
MLDDNDDNDEFVFPEIVEIPIDGILDLHAFNPAEVKDLVREYLEECRNSDILEVRIIHGKGRGVLRNIVHSVLSDIPYVRKHRPDIDTGNWGATLVFLDRN